MSDASCEPASLEPFPGGLEVPKALLPVAAEVVTLTDAVCLELLDAEYARLARKAVAALARKRPSPLLRGQAPTWAAGVVHAVGHVNFLFYRSSTPHVTTDDLSAAFGLAKNTISAKSKRVCETLGMSHFSSEFMRDDTIRRSSLPWLVMVDGIAHDARDLPHEQQAEAFRRGLIPYMPASGSRP